MIVSSLPPAVARGWVIALCGWGLSASGGGCASDFAPATNVLFDAQLGVMDAGWLGDELVPGGGGARGADAPHGPVTGMVVDLLTTRPLSNRTILVGSETTKTDATGRFAIGSADATYDVTIADPDGLTVTIYRALTRRDPTLVHVPSDIRGPARWQAQVSGQLSGGGPYPVAPTDAVSVYFFADEADNVALIGGTLPPGYQGPGYGPMHLDWDGPESITGELVALGTFAAVNGSGPPTWYAHQSLTITKDLNATVDLDLASVTFASVAGHIDAPVNVSVQEKQAFYRLRRRHAMIGLTEDTSTSASFAFTLPDLGGLGAELCVVGAGSPGLAMTQKCGVPLGSADVTVSIQAGPSFTAPADGTVVDESTSFHWTTFTDGVYMLSLQANRATQTSPSIYVLTASATAGWPDLRALGVAFPTNAGYRCTIAGLGPFATMDASIGPQGLGAPLRSEVRNSQSASIDLTTGP